ncbi:MAG TPA: SDR family NAD(P)-dependent oxidoreductase, partial [Micromonosporaceae bacterium]
MTNATTTAAGPRDRDLTGQTVVLIGGSAGIGLETARLARTYGADVILAARDPAKLKQAADDVGARDTAAFDATDWAGLDAFFNALPAPVNHILVTAGGSYYAPLAEIDLDRADKDLQSHLWLTLRIARH